MGKCKASSILLSTPKEILLDKFLQRTAWVLAKEIEITERGLSIEINREPEIIEAGPMVMVNFTPAHYPVVPRKSPTLVLVQSSDPSMNNPPVPPIAADFAHRSTGPTDSPLAYQLPEHYRPSQPASPIIEPLWKNKKKALLAAVRITRSAANKPDKSNFCIPRTHQTLEPFTFMRQQELAALAPMFKVIVTEAMAPILIRFADLVAKLDSMRCTHNHNLTSDSINGDTNGGPKIGLQTNSDFPGHPEWDIRITKRSKMVNGNSLTYVPINLRPRSKVKPHTSLRP